MRKKQELLESRDALRIDLKAQLDAFQVLENGPSDEDWTAYNAKKVELDGVTAQLDSIATLEDEARLFADATVGTVGNTTHDLAQDKPWETFGAFLLGVARAQTPGGIVDPRLREELAISGASEAVGADGGFLVTQDHSTALLAKAQETAVLAPLCTTIPLSGSANSIVLPFIKETSRATGSRWGGVRVYRRDEGLTVTASKPGFDELEIKAEPLMGLAYATEELLQDAAAINAVFTNAFASEFAFKIDEEIFGGNGSGRCLGILKAKCLVTQAKETGQADATIVFENISKMWSRILPRAKARGSWFINSEITPQLHQMALAVGTGGTPVYMPAGGVSAAPYGVILGRPVVEIEQAEALGTAGDIVFADFSEYLLVTKGGLKADQSMHVRFLYNEMTFRWTHRINGQPAVTSALTPYKGSATQSPFVALADRP